MGYTVNFMDNGLVTAEFLNETAAELGGGVLAFANEETYGVDQLNSISAELITKGVSRGCALSVSEGTVTIAEGVLYFANGRRVTIDSAGVTMELVPDALNYVWFGYDEVTDFVAPRCTAEAPDVEEHVLLGTVTAEAAVLGKPELAVMKNPYLGLHFTESLSKSFKWNNNAEEELLWEIDLSDVGYRFAIVHSPGYEKVDKVHNAFCGFVNVQDKTAFSVLNTYTYYLSDGTEAYPHSSTEGEVLVGCALNTNVEDADYRKYFFVYLRFDLGSDNVLRVYQRAEESGMSGTTYTEGTDITVTLC